MAADPPLLACRSEQPISELFLSVNGLGFCISAYLLVTQSNPRNPLPLLGADHSVPAIFSTPPFDSHICQKTVMANDASSQQRQSGRWPAPRSNQVPHHNSTPLIVIGGPEDRSSTHLNTTYGATWGNSYSEYDDPRTFQSINPHLVVAIPSCFIHYCLYATNL